MCAGSDYGAVVSSTITKGAKRVEVQKLSKNNQSTRRRNLPLMMGVGTLVREVLRGPGGYNPSGKQQIEEYEEWYVSKEDIASMIVVQIDYAIKRKGIITKDRRDYK